MRGYLFLFHFTLQIFDAANDDVVPSWLKDPPKASYILVRFFGTYDM